MEKDSKEEELWNMVATTLRTMAGDVVIAEEGKIDDRMHEGPRSRYTIFQKELMS